MFTIYIAKNERIVGCAIFILFLYLCLYHLIIFVNWFGLRENREERLFLYLFYIYVYRRDWTSYEIVVNLYTWLSCLFFAFTIFILFNHLKTSIQSPFKHQFKGKSFNHMWILCKNSHMVRNKQMIAYLQAH